jgi:serralysin
MASVTPVIATGNNNIDALLKKNKWASSTVTFSFTNSFSDYGSNYPYGNEYRQGYQPLLAYQQATARAWLAQYASVSLLKPVEVSGSNDRNATIRIALSNKPSGGEAFAPSTTAAGGDVWFNPSAFSHVELGTYAYHGIGHEIGHAVGLRHGHAVEPGEDLRDVVTDPLKDSMEYSIMTYRSYVGHNPDLTNSYSNGAYDYAQSLMIYDIRAIQHLYGANFNYNANDTVYTFSNTTGEMFIDGVGQGRPGANRVFRTIWDGNGVDTYNFSNYTTNLTINLTPGEWSDLDSGGNSQRANLDISGNHYARGHVFNALQYNSDLRSLIENAVGGSGNDVIFGNSVGNILNGRGGNDRIYNVTSNSAIRGHDITLGDIGDDTIVDMDSIDGDFHDGGLGIDWIVYSNYDFGDALPVIDLTTSKFTLGSTFETINNFENVVGTRGSDTIIGSSVANILQGDSGFDILQGNDGNDTLSGDAGADVLNGGAGSDVMSGGSDNDIYTIDNAGDIVTEAASSDIDTIISHLANYTLIANVENLTLSGTQPIAALNGIGNNLNNDIQGNEVNNVLSGLDGNDFLYGKAGQDTLNGGANNDLLQGDSGSDSLNGSIGDDELHGGAGVDTLTGGAGKDRFDFNNPLEGIDTITDFVVIDDVIYVEKVGFIGGLVKGFLSADQFRIGASAQDASDRFIYNQTTGALFFDGDGNGGAAQTQFAKLSTNLAMTNQDIFVTSIGI